VAQKNTTEVKALTTKSDKLKSELIVKNVPEEEAGQALAVNSTPGSASSQQQSQSQPQAESQTSTQTAEAVKPVEQQQANSAESESSESDVVTGVSPEVKSDVNKTDDQVQPTPQQLEKQSEQGITTTENKAGVSSQPGSQSETGTDVPAIKGEGVTAQTITGKPAATENSSEEITKESPASSSGESSQPAGEISPAKEEEPATVTGGNEKQSDPVFSGQQMVSSKENNPSGDGEKSADINEEPEERGIAEAPQTKVERESNATGQQPSKLVFENEVSDATTFSLSKPNAPTASSEIPMDPTLPEGLVFKVQIGAFRKPLPASTFNNLQPLSGETSRPGWIRYCLGLFRTFEPANLLKKEVRTMGYKDAFVVAYYNGKRIPLYEAYGIISKANAADKQTYSNVSSSEFKQLEKYEIKKSSFDLKPDADTKAFYGTTENVPADLVEYAVQVGVYKSSRTPSALNPLAPLNTEQMSSGLYRFTTGRFDNRQSADSMKRVAVNAGIKDAFVVIYKGGRKAGQRESQQIASAARREAASNTGASNTTTAPVSVAPATNESVSASDIVFKIQLGAFRENVPFSAVNAFLAVADKGITQETDARGLHIFYAGQYTDYNQALSSRSEIVSKGVKDAFIVAFVKGKRTSATEALKLLNRN